jgi:hypothetical protein
MPQQALLKGLMEGFFEISRRFQRNKQKLYNYFFPEKQSQKLKTMSAYKESLHLILRQSKNIHLVTQSLSDYFRIFLFYEYSYFGLLLNCAYVVFSTLLHTVQYIALRIQLCGMIGLKFCLLLTC